MTSFARFLLVLLAVVAVGCKPAAKKKSNGLEGGDIKFSVNGNDRGRVEFAPGVHREHAAVVGEVLRDKGWFLTREENRSAVTDKARGTFMHNPDAKTAGNARSDKVAKVRPRGAGLEVIVYTDLQWVDSTDLSDFGAESAPEISKRISAPVRFVIRGEKEKAQTVEWQDVYFDWPDAETADARSKGR